MLPHVDWGPYPEIRTCVSYELFHHNSVLEADCKQELQNWSDFDLAIEHNSMNICWRYGS